MIIDAHTHVYPEKIVTKAIQKLEHNSHIRAKSDGTTEGLLASMKEAGIDYSLLLPVATSAKQVSGINTLAAQTNASGRETGLFSFGGMHPDTEDYKQELRRIKDDGIKGIKLHPDYQGTFFNDIRYKRIVDAATELSLYIVVHSGVDIGMPDPVHCPPFAVLDVIRDTGSDRLILAHMGGWRMWEEVMDRLVGRDVIFDTAFSTDGMPDVDGMLKKEQFITMVREHGADRIVFGTDSPWASQKESVQWMKECGLSEEEKEKIFFENMAQILQIG